MEPLFLILLAIIAVFALLTSVRIVNQYEKGLVMRLGKYRNTVSSGVAFVLPFIEAMIKVDMREKVIQSNSRRSILQKILPWL